MGRLKEWTHKAQFAGRVVLFVLICLALGPLPFSHASVAWEEGRLTAVVEDMPLVEFLAKLSDLTGIDIAVSKELKLENISLKLTERPLDEAIKTILKGYSYAAVYTKQGTAFQIEAITVYPKDAKGGAVVKLAKVLDASGYSNRKGMTKTVFVGFGEPFETRGHLSQRGLLIPSQTVGYSSGNTFPDKHFESPVTILNARAQIKERAYYQELILMEKKIAGLQDPEKKLAVSQAYATALFKFKAMKNAHLNRIEALRRIKRLNDASY